METNLDWQGVVDSAISWTAFECRLKNLDTIDLPDLLLESPMMARAAKTIIATRPELKEAVQACIENLMAPGGF
jgi:hypothetical protein